MSITIAPKDMAEYELKAKSGIKINSVVYPSFSWGDSLNDKEPSPRKVAIIGNGADKFTIVGAERAKRQIQAILTWGQPVSVISGHSPMGGVDIWAEEIADLMEIPLDLKVPDTHEWNPDEGYGYRARNIDIATDCTEIHIIVAREYPFAYRGRRFSYCYHCVDNESRDCKGHVKSGACWTANQAQKLGKYPSYYSISNR